MSSVGGRKTLKRRRNKGRKLLSVKKFSKKSRRR